jgi:predicted short-subunit dehydrogenase-like oxidoreductase (DUF2520 family)
VPALPATVIVGAGRIGQGIGGMLVDRGVSVRFAVRPGVKSLPAPAGLVHDPATYHRARWILLAVPDDAIWDVAGELGELGVVKAGSVALHFSGVKDRDALKPLRLTGAALGSFHPLQSIALPETAADRIPGSFVGIEGDDRALRAGRRLADCLGMIAVEVTAAIKPAYHAAATLASTYVVVLYEAAVQIATKAGIDAAVARAMFQPIMRGAVSNLELLPPAHAMTGAVRRGDLGTIRAHLEALEGSDRELYLALGRRAVGLARRLDLGAARLAAMERLFGGGSRPS